VLKLFPSDEQLFKVETEFNSGIEWYMSHSPSLHQLNMIITHRILIIVLSMVFVDKISGLSFVTEQNKTTMVFTGSNQTFTWQLRLTDQEKSKQLTVQFGRWDKELDNVKGGYLMTFIQEPSGNGSVGTWNLKRLQWLGDLTRDYFVVFKLFNVKLSDAGDYGIRFRVDGFPIKTKQSWFTLSVQDPPPLPTEPPEPQNITLYVEEGNELNMTCRNGRKTSSSVLWTRNGIPVQTGKSRFLYIKIINRTDAGNYRCVSLSYDGNHSSPITTVDVLYAPGIQLPSNKQVSIELVRGNSTTLNCVAAANPSPTFTWRKGKHENSDGFYSTWNSSSLKVSPVSTDDFTSYVCTAKNRLGWDSATFDLHEKGLKVSDKTAASTQLKGAEDRLIQYLPIIAVLAVIVICAFLIKRYLAKRSRRQVKHHQNNDAEGNHTYVFLKLKHAISLILFSLISYFTHRFLFSFFNLSIS